MTGECLVQIKVFLMLINLLAAVAPTQMSLCPNSILINIVIHTNYLVPRKPNRIIASSFLYENMLPDTNQPSSRRRLEN